MSGIRSVLHTIKHYFKIKEYCSDKDFLMLNTPSHDNLGDHAIAVAEKAFFSEDFPDVKYGEVTGDYFRGHSSLYKKCIKKSTVLGICGGGYLGNVWMNEEELVRNVLMLFPENRIVIFPQTIFYQDNESGRAEWFITRELYKRHRESLYVFLRDQRSYDFFRRELPELQNVYLVPDMVLYLSKDFNIERNGISICFRADKEGCLPESVSEAIKEHIREYGYPCGPINTILDRGVNLDERDSEVEKKLREFASAKLVITDRLHAMIFAAITGTPCLAFDNETKKVSGVYEWIKELPYVNFLLSDACDYKAVTDPIYKMYNTSEKYTYVPDYSKWDSLTSTIKELTAHGG